MKLEQYLVEVKRTMPNLIAEESIIAMLAMGLADESGEFLGIIKKYLFHGHNLDIEHIKEELGDVTWYLANILNHYGIDPEEIFKKNIDKLKKRYPNGFSEERSRNRDSDIIYRHQAGAATLIEGESIRRTK